MDPYGSLPAGRVRWEIEEQLGEVLGPGEHRPVSRGQLDAAPLGSGASAEYGGVAGDHLLYLSQRETAQNPELRQLFSGGVLQPQRLSVGTKRLRDGSGAK